MCLQTRSKDKKMFITDNTFISCNAFSYLIPNRNGLKPYVVLPTLAKKNDLSGTSRKENKAPLPLKLPTHNILLIQSAIGVFALGFIDAGYSGDWSRVGVIPRGAEDLLKVAAFLVVPLCLFLIFSLSQKDED